MLGEEAHAQDPNGNRIQEGQFRLFWDSFDRLVRVERASDGMVVGRYRYDALSRRVDRSFVALGEVAAQQVFHVHDGAQEVEELDASGALLADFVWGDMYVDDLVQLRRGGQRYWAHSNSIYSVAALSDASGATVERYAYQSIYGVCSVRDGEGAPRVLSAELGNPWRFQGRRFDPETGWLHLRLRQLDPVLGRFVSRDRQGAWTDPAVLGNEYSFVGGDPVNAVDPSGLKKQPLHHIFPQQFRKTFDELFDPGFTDRFTIKIPQKRHQELHVDYEWNKKWQTLLEGDEFACADDAKKRRMILEQVKKMAEETDLDLSSVRPFRGKLSNVKGSSAAEFSDYFKKNTTVSKKWISKLAGGLFAGVLGTAMALGEAAKVVEDRRFQLALKSYKQSDDQRGDGHMKKFIYEDLPSLGLDGKATVAAQHVLSEAFGQ